MQKTIISLLTLGLILCAGVSLAQDETTFELDEDITAEDLGVGEPNILPDNPLYFFKGLARTIQSTFTFGSVKKAELKLRFANEKLIEAKKLAEKKKDSKVIKIGLDRYQEEMERIEVATEKIKEKASENIKVSAFLDKFTKQQALHYSILQKLEGQVPEDALQKIQETREMHLEKFGEVMIKLENKEKIQERLEKNLQVTEDSGFKELQNLELLKGLEAKAPEAIKDAVRNVQQNTWQRIDKAIENAMPEIKQNLIQTKEKILERVKTENKIQEQAQVETQTQNKTQLENQIQEIQQKLKQLGQ